MATETLGVRRLYDALGCNVLSEIRVTASLPDGMQVNLYIGAHPPLGVLKIVSDKYGIPGRTTTILHTDKEYMSDCYLEISVTFKHEADEGASRGLRDGDETARATLLKVANERSPLCEKLIDAISGIIGLKIHRQFVLKPLVENAFISSGPEPVSSFFGPSVEMLEPITLNTTAESVIANYLGSLKTNSEETIAKGGAILHWLLKAWRESDPVSKFVYLFIPLEAILPSDIGISPETELRINSLSELVTSSDVDDKEMLLAFLETTRTKFGPTLSARFEKFAKQAAMPGWELDVTAFNKYNRMRNLLFHAGRRNISVHLNIEEQTRTLEDLVERYLGIALLGSHEVYPSRWRPTRPSL